MNSLDFLEAIGDIDDSFVFEVKELKTGRKAMWGIPLVMKVAACLFLVIGLALFWQSNRNYQHNMKSGEEKGIDENAVISGKESGEGHNSGSTDWNDEVPEADADIKDKKMSSPEPLAGIDSQVTMTAKMKKDVLVIKVENKSGHKISFGAEYVLYRKNNRGRERIKYLPDVGVEDIAYFVKKDETYTDEIKLSDLFGELKNGEYVIEKEISLLDSRVVASAEFEIKQPVVGIDSQVTMTAKMKKDVLVIKVENKSGRTIFVDEDQLLYRKNNGERERIESLRAGEEGSRFVEKGKTYTLEIKLSDEYGDLESGEYVIEKEVGIKGSRVVMSAEFEIRQPVVGINSKVTMTAKMKKDVLVIKVENKSGREMLVGAEHILYRKNNGKRERIEYLPKVEVPDWARLIAKDKTYTDKIKLSDVFGELESGEYVIEKDISVEGSSFVVSAEFEIKN